MNQKTRKTLMTVRAALIMIVKAIEEYCKDDEVVKTNGESITLSITQD